MQGIDTKKCVGSMTRQNRARLLVATDRDGGTVPNPEPAGFY